MSNAALKLWSGVFHFRSDKKINRLIVGVGNFYYPHSRYSVGYTMVDRLAKYMNLQWKLRPELYGWYTEGESGDTKFALVKPRTYIPYANDKAVKEALPFYRVSPDQLYVIHHDFELEVGKVKHQKGIFSSLQTKQYEKKENVPIFRISRAIETELFHRVSVGVAPRKTNGFSNPDIDGTMMDHKIQLMRSMNKFPLDEQLLIEKKFLGSHSILRELLLNKEPLKTI